MRFLQLLAIALTSAIATSCASQHKPYKLSDSRVFEKAEEIRKSNLDARKIYLFSFDNHGRLVNPLEVRRAANELPEWARQHRGSRIVVLSFGWNNRRDKAVESYMHFAKEYARKSGYPADSALICVVWDSKLNLAAPIRDVIPASYVADTIGALPDNLLSPLTFWSKAALADRIGRGELRDSLEYIYREFDQTRTPPPSLYVIGHSFGCRILNKLSPKNEKSDLATQYHFWDHLKGSVFVHPAMPVAKLRVSEKYVRGPVVVVHSRHDHANGFLYPIANIPLNTAGGSFSWLAHLSRRSMGPTERWITRPLKETGALLGSVVEGAMFLPTGLIKAQVKELNQGPRSYAANTLENIPLAEIPVEEARKMAKHRPRSQKGLFNLGERHESLGHLDAPQAADRSLSLSPNTRRPDLRNLTYYVESADYKVNGKTADNIGTFNINLTKPLTNYTIGWFDPIGTHNSILDRAELYQLIGYVLHHSETQ